MEIDNTLRQHWMAVLARCPTDRLEQAVAQWNTDGPWQRLRAPQTGLVMVRGRIGGTGDAFNLGELAVTRCTVQLANGRVGHAYIKGRDHRQAESAAVLDGLLQDPELQADLLVKLIQPEAARQASRKEHRSRQAAATRVDFYTMNRGAA